MKKIITYFSNVKDLLRAILDVKDLLRDILNVKDLLRDILKELSKISYYLYCLNQKIDSYEVSK